MKKVIVFIGLSFLLVNVAFAVTKTTTATGSGEWNTTATWDNGVPDGDDEVIIPSGITITYTGDFNMASGSTDWNILTINSGGSFTITGSFNPGNLTGDVITNNGTMQVDGAFLIKESVSVTNGGTLIATTSMNIEHAATSVTNTGTITVGTTFNMNSGNFDNQAGALLDVEGTGDFTNVVDVNNAGTIDILGQTTIDIDVAATGIDNTGGVFNARGNLNVALSDENPCLYNGTVNYWGTLNQSGVCQVTGNVGTLPVELVDFYGQQVGSEIELEWTTASEENNAYFNIESSRDSYAYSKIGEVAGNGTTSDASYYSFIHADPSAGLNYYRLLQVDFDGTSSYSDIISVYNVQEANLLENAIVKRGTPLVLTGVSLKANVILSSAGGLSKLLSVDAETLEVQTEDLMPGAYFISINHEDKYVQKVNFIVVD